MNVVFASLARIYRLCRHIELCKLKQVEKVREVASRNKKA